MRVLLTVPSLDRGFGGPLGKARDLVTELGAAGVDVRLVGGGDAGGPLERGLGAAARFHATPVPRRVGPLPGLVRGADVVHVLGFRDPVGTLAAVVARRARVPYVLEPTGMVHPRLRSLGLKRTFDATAGRRVLHGAGAVVATSELEAAELREHDVPADRLRVRVNGVRFEGLWPLPWRGAFRGTHGIPADVPLVLTIARLGAVKGLPTLVRAVADLPEVHLVIAGPDERDGTLELLQALRRSLAERILVLTEGIWGETKRQALADADLFCLPSDYESFGTAAAEAAGCGLPVVVTSACGVAEVLAPRTCRVVPPGQVEALARAIGELLGLGDGRRAAGRAAVALRERLDWGRLVGEQLEIYGDAGA